MLTKFLLTATVIWVAWLVIRSRSRPQGDAVPRSEAGSPRGVQESAGLMPRGAVKLAAYGLVVLMLVGTGFYLFQGWQREREIVQLQVVNVYSGKVERYEARRGDIRQRSFVTHDGRRIQIAEMERLIQLEPGR
jgi:hypothetical protein